MPLPEPQKSTAPYLYKYSSPDHLEWLRDILLKHELYLPTLCELNDNNDGLPHLALQPEEDMAAYLCANLHSYRPDLSAAELPHERDVIRYNVKHHGRAALQPIMVRILDKELEGYRIYSMTKRYDRMNMWALYAGNHRGYCLEFENTGDLFCHAKDVSYLEKTAMDISIDDPTLRKGYFFFCKTKDWSNEDEVRVVQSRVDPHNKVQISAKWLTRIIIGKDVKPEHEDQIREWARLRKPELKVVKAYYDAPSRAIKVKE
jgi:hypothetical protein